MGWGKSYSVWVAESTVMANVARGQANLVFSASKSGPEVMKDAVPLVFPQIAGRMDSWNRGFGLRIKAFS